MLATGYLRLPWFLQQAFRLSFSENSCPVTFYFHLRRRPSLASFAFLVRECLGLDFVAATMSDVKETVRRVFQLYELYGEKEYIGEPVSQVEHMLQCAMLAEEEGWVTEYVLAALFHDIGHLVAFDKDNVRRMVVKVGTDDETSLGAMEHGKLGAAFLKDAGFPPLVYDTVQAHVNAKRYLVYADPSYHDKLSDASKQTLIFQGGPMTKEEAEEFRNADFFNGAIRLRYWDDKAKVEGMKCKPLSYYEEMCWEYLEAVKIVNGSS